jgi:DNA-3-methyladenine glycosylase II
MNEQAIHGAGFSQAKVAALRDLAAKTLDGTVPTGAIVRNLDDEAIIERLITVRGIGRWTVEMLLIFQLGRPDVLPVDDFGVRNGFRIAYGLRKMPTPKKVARHGERWKPYRTAAAWYLWRAADQAKAGS